MYGFGRCAVRTSSRGKVCVQYIYSKSGSTDAAENQLTPRSMKVRRAILTKSIDELSIEHSHRNVKYTL